MKEELKTKIVVIIFICMSVNSLGQKAPDTFKVGEYTYPYPSISNLLKWLDLSTMEWETEMKKYDFTDRGLDKACVFYGSGASLRKSEEIIGLFSIEKCPGKIMESMWNDFTGQGITKLDALVNELEPYYKETDEHGYTFYAFRDDNYAYEFSLLRDRDMEIVNVRKILLQK